MFTNITRKTVIYVMATVFITLVFVVFAIFNLSKSILNDDYTEKIIRFSKQEAINCSTKLELLAINMDNIINALNVSDSLFATKTSAEIAMQLQQKTRYSPYIRDVYIYKNEDMIYYFRSKDDVPKITEYVKNNILNETKNNIWLSMAAMNKNNLYYIKKLDNNVFVAFYVDAAEIFDVFKNTSPFFEKESTFFFSKNQLCMFSSKDVSQKIIENAFNGKYNELTFEKGKIILTLPIDKTTLNVCTIAKSSYINSNTMLLVKLFLVILILTMLFCYYMINRFAKEITIGLGEIHNKILRYHE